MKTQFTIGDKVYPKDNSWQRDLMSGENSSLGGTAWKNAVMVEIISNPFKMLIVKEGRQRHEHEFVLVRYNGRVYSTLNKFSETMPQRPVLIYP